MEEYKQDREKQRKLSRVAGIGLTLVLHAAALSCACFAGMTYLDPPPPEREEILIDFDEPEIELKKPERSSISCSFPVPVMLTSKNAPEQSPVAAAKSST